MKHRIPQAVLGTISLVLAIACTPERAVLPEVGRPSFIMGDVPTNRLLGGTPTLTFSQVAGAIRVELSVNRGLLTASQTGEADFRIVTRLELSNDGGQRIIDGGECPLADLKVEAIEPKNDPLVRVSFSIPWDGNDANGEPMGGALSATYAFQLFHAPSGQAVDPKTDPLRAVGRPLTGLGVVGSSVDDLNVGDPGADLLGGTPTNSLLGTTPTITYSAADGGFTVMTEVNRGIFEASHMGEADFRIATEFTITNDAGQRIIVGGECPVADLKVEAVEPKQDPLLGVSFSVAWDGLDGNGNAMTGDATVGYSFQILHTSDGYVMDPIGRPVSGSTRVSLGGGTQLQ